MSAAETCTAMPSDRVNLVDEDDAGRVLLALFKEIAHAAGAHADKHFHEVRTGNREEGNVGLSSYRARQQRLARSRRSDKQDTLRNSSAQLLELLRIFQELNNFLQLFLGLVRTGDVLERSLLLLRGEQPCAGLAKTQGLVSARLPLPHQEQTEAHEKNQRRGVQQDQHPVAAAHFLHLQLYGLVPQGLRHRRRFFLRNGDLEFHVRGLDVLALQIVAVRGEIHRHFLHLARIDLGHPHAVRGSILARLCPVGGHQLPEHHAQKDDRDPKENCFCRGTGIHVDLTNPATHRKKIRSCLYLPPLATFPGRPIRSGRKLPEIAPHPVWCRKAIANPHLFRCGSEAKVLRLQGYPPLRRLIQKHCQANRARLAFAKPPQQKFLCYSAFQHCINHQNVPALQFRLRTKVNFAPRATAVLDVPHFFANEVANNRRVDLPHQVRRENKTAIQRDDHIQPPPLALSRNLFPQSRHACGDARRGIRRSLSAAQICLSSATTIPARVLSFAANSAATGKPRAQARTPPLVSTGQPLRSHWLTRFSFNRRFSLWVLR